MNVKVWLAEVAGSVFTDRNASVGVPALRLALGIVFLWFGWLKILDLSPVKDLIFQTYNFLPQPLFFSFLGLLEVAIGIGLILKLRLRLILALLWLQLAGTFLALALNPSTFYLNHNPFLLTLKGEFIVKNLILLAGSLVVGGYEIGRQE